MHRSSTVSTCTKSAARMPRACAVRNCLFAGVPHRFEAARYHSLLVAAESLPPALTVTARTREGIPMALRHATQPVEGVQFHPESVLTIHGTAIMRNFIQAIGRWRTGSSWTQITAQSATGVRGSTP
jgi:anthranilate/para-aminobenzoate synthase component II